LNWLETSEPSGSGESDLSYIEDLPLFNERVEYNHTLPPPLSPELWLAGGINRIHSFIHSMNVRTTTDGVGVIQIFV
ncbi:hypothetical protein E4T56_gene15696, partial [Termitomyces sp. T112]